MPSIMTIARKEQQRKTSRKKYQNQKRKGQVNLKSKWHYAFIGKLPKEELRKIFGIS